MLGFLVFLVIAGFVTGALARLAVPGPDPMPFWLTTGFGIAGSLLGGLVAYGVFGGPNGFPFGFVGAVVLVILYRRFVQKRGITGPEAKAQPTRGWGLRKRQASSGDRD
jgi:uncharacterized membrane protein YeaQ/YmgE (transglycosylase-associated protein family)